MSEKRLNVRLSEEAYEELAELAKSQNKTMSVLIRDALSLEQWFYEANKDGGRVLVQRPGEDQPKQVIMAR